MGIQPLKMPKPMSSLLKSEIFIGIQGRSIPGFHEI